MKKPRGHQIEITIYSPQMADIRLDGDLVETYENDVQAENLCKAFVRGLVWGRMWKEGEYSVKYLENPKAV